MVHESILVNNSLEEAENILKEIIPSINGKIKNISDEEYSIEWTYLYGLQTIHCETKLIPHKKGIEVFSTANADDVYKTGAKKALKNLYTALSQRINGKIRNKKNITTQSLQSPNNTDYKSFIIVIVAVVLIIMYSNPPSKYKPTSATTSKATTPKSLRIGDIRITKPGAAAAYTEENLVKAMRYLQNDDAAFNHMYNIGYIFDLPANVEVHVMEVKVLKGIAKVRFKGTITEIWVPAKALK